MTLDPRAGIREAVAVAETDEGPVAEPAPAAPRLSLAAAIDAYTSGAAYASFDEHRKGTLNAGKLADMVILSADIFGAPADRLLDIQVEVTIFDGKVVYSHADSKD